MYCRPFIGSHLINMRIICQLRQEMHNLQRPECAILHNDCSYIDYSRNMLWIPQKLILNLSGKGEFVRWSEGRTLCALLTQGIFSTTKECWSKLRRLLWRWRRHATIYLFKTGVYITEQPTNGYPVACWKKNLKIPSVPSEVFRGTIHKIKEVRSTGKIRLSNSSHNSDCKYDGLQVLSCYKTGGGDHCQSYHGWLLQVPCVWPAALQSGSTVKGGGRLCRIFLCVMGTLANYMYGGPLIANICYRYSGRRLCGDFDVTRLHSMARNEP